MSLAALLVVIGCESLQTATADGETRTISFHHTHTNENLTITYKVNGRYDEAALKKINHVLRDWREDKPINMDPHVIDLIWEVYQEVGGKEPISIICGYRSPDTNAMLRRRSSGVAKFSQHMLGKAVDFMIPGVPLDKLREAGLRAQRGGVGFYPSSNFVHLDTGGVRHWPRMPEAQLARVLAKGPLTAYKRAGSDTQVASAAPTFSNPLAKLFGGGQNDEGRESAPAPVSRSTTTAARTESPKTEKPAMVAAVPMPVARPGAKPEPIKPEPIKPDLAKAEPKIDLKPETKPAGGFDLASASSRPVSMRPAQSASLVGPSPAQVASANEVISARGFWQGLPEPAQPSLSSTAKTNAATSPAPQRTASAAGETGATGSLTPWPMPSREPAEGALAYAPVTPAPAQARSAPMGNTAARSTSPDMTVATKRSGSKPTIVSTPAVDPGPVKAGQRFNDPWMRAMIVSPSAGGFMSTSLLGAPDYRVLGPYLQKPTTSVMMTFSDDPYLGLSTTKFSGTAVVFVSTITFYQRTAALQ